MRFRNQPEHKRFGSIRVSLQTLERHSTRQISGYILRKIVFIEIHYSRAIWTMQILRKVQLEDSKIHGIMVARQLVVYKGRGACAITPCKQMIVMRGNSVRRRHS
ncbi:hypothetical protein ABW21_db0207954 [Orbilia brochopaga]|nr:hypothetical protein ABW21_db0207954 [Drechslerella brochopaga]